MKPTLPTEITTEEKNAGFIQQMVKTGYGSITGGDDLSEAAIKPLSKGLRILKTDEGIYALQALDAGKDSDSLDSWRPLPESPISFQQAKFKK